MPRLTYRTLIALTLFAFAASVVPAAATPFEFDQTWFFNDAAPSSQLFANNAIEVQITSIDSSFTGLDVQALDTTQGAFANQAGAFSGSNCLPYITGGDCIVYVITPIAGHDVGYTGPIDITIAWLLDTNPISGAPFIIQAEGTDAFSFELRGQNYLPRGTGNIPLGTDPADGGTTDNFSRVAVVYDPTAVPEPATLLLVGSGFVGLVRSRRRRHQ